MLFQLQKQKQRKINNILSIIGSLIKILYINQDCKPIATCKPEATCKPDPICLINLEQKKYSEIASTYPFDKQIAIIVGFDPKFDISPYKNIKPDDYVKTMNNLLKIIFDHTSLIMLNQLDLLYSRTLSVTESDEEIKRRKIEICELKQTIHQHNSNLNNYFLRKINPNSPALKFWGTQ